MDNFTYYNPTRVVFGKGTIEQIKTLVPAGAKVLVTYGGGSIKRNGVYEQVMRALAGRKAVEFGGIQPNPRYETLIEAVKLGRREQVTFLLAVGGGSVLDGTKFVAAAIPFTDSQDPWDILAKGAEVKAAVALGSVLTLPATGSETNPFAVISRGSTHEKQAFYCEKIIPQFAVLDPMTTMSLPEKQTRNGIVDAFAHVMELYVTYPAAAPLQDRYSEGVLQTLVETGPALLTKPQDYDLRATVMWCATQALSLLLGCGVPQDWSTHMIAHELTAFYGLDHAETLAVVMPALLRAQKEGKAAKLLQFAQRVWGVTTTKESAAIEEGIVRMERFFGALGMPTKLAAYQILASEAADKVSTRFAQRGTVLGERKDLTPERVKGILLAC